MGASRQRALAMIILVVMPLCVASITGLGFWRLSAAMSNLGDEYDEIRGLEDIDEDVTSARLVMESGSPAMRETARGMLEKASAALVSYLAEQSEQESDPTHQAIEAAEATKLIALLHSIVEADPSTMQAQVSRVGEVRAGLDRLKRAADTNVRASQAMAQTARRSTLVWVITSSILCSGLCIALISWANHDVNKRLRSVYLRLARQSGTPAPPASRELVGIVSQIEGLGSGLADRIEESGRELLRRERLAAIGVLAADIAHEINNPMNAVLGLTELGLQTIQRAPVDEHARADIEESLRIVCREAGRCKVIVERFLAMARTDRRPGIFDATSLVRETIQVAQAARPDRASCFVQTAEQLSIPAFAKASDVRQILLTLLINAADAIEGDGRVEVDATRTDSEIWIRVRDDGCGFSDDVRQQLFTPFQSLSEHGKGLGLGLSIAHTLAASMGAALRAFSDGPGKGSTFIIAIPAREFQP